MLSEREYIQASRIHEMLMELLQSSDVPPSISASFAKSISNVKDDYEAKMILERIRTGEEDEIINYTK